MRTPLVALLMLALTLAGCLDGGSDDDAADEDVPPTEDDDTDETEWEDRDWYYYDPVTHLCHVKDYEDIGDGLYIAELSGGTWVIAETNGVPGLQIENNHPEQGTGSFSLDIPDCQGGDQVLV